MVFSKNKVKMFKWNHEKPGKWFHCKVCFYNNIDSFWRPLPLRFLGKTRARKRKTPSSRHFYGLTSHWPHLSTDQSAKTHPVIEKRQQQDLGERKTNYTGKFELALTKTQNNPENLKEVKWKSKQKR